MPESCQRERHPARQDVSSWVMQLGRVSSKWNSAGIPIEMVKDVFRVHWYWKRFNSTEDPEGARVQKELEALLEQRKQARKHKAHELGSPKSSVESSKIDAVVEEPGQEKLVKANSRGSGKLA